MTYEFYGYPADWLDKFPAEIQKVTAADVNRVAAKYVHRDQLAVLVVATRKSSTSRSRHSAPVKEIDIAIPPPAGAKEEENPKATASNDEGKAMAAKVVAAMGGEAKLAAIRSIKAKITLTQKTPQGDFPMQMESIIVFPGSSACGNANSQRNNTIVVTPDAAFLELPNGQMQNWPEARKTETLEQIKRDPVFIAAHAEGSQLFLSRR